MVVFCEKCNSKFQVDDAKVPESGIKARCSVCSHAFILKKEPAVSATPVIAADKPEPAVKDINPNTFKAVPAAPAKEATGIHSFFSGSRSEFNVKPAADNQFVVEITEHDDHDDVHEIYESEDKASGLAEAFSAEPAPTKQPFGYEAFASFVERQKEESKPESEPISSIDGSKGVSAVSEPVVQKPAIEGTAAAVTRLPEVLNTSGALPAAAKPEREIVNLLDDRGMTDDYVVQMVQEICNAVKYVEGVEKPDWPTRMMGLDMLCKIKGLYAGEKREDPANRQLQIVAGINM